MSKIKEGDLVKIINQNYFFYNKIAIIIGFYSESVFYMSFNIYRVFINGRIKTFNELSFKKL